MPLPPQFSRLSRHLGRGFKNAAHPPAWKRFPAWLANAAAYALDILALPSIYEWSSNLLKFNARRLTAQEIEMARSVFGDSLDYNRIRVDERALVWTSWSGGAYVSFHTINCWGPLYPSLLIHELTHIWQYRRMGAVYIPRALRAQWNKGYDYGGLPALEAHKNTGLKAFNLEQQAEILTDYFKIKNGMRPLWGNAKPSDLPIYEIYANEARSA